MGINTKVMSALSELNIPVSFQVYAGTADTYITFFCYLENGEMFADDVQQGTGYYIQVDLWSKSNYTDMVEQAKAVMRNAGFSLLSAHDLYEADTKVYHKVLRFYYLEV